MATTPVGIAYSSPVNFFISQSPPEEVPDDTKSAFAEVYNAIQNIIQALVNQAGIGPQPGPNWAQLAGTSITLLSGNLTRFYAIATESISFGAMISIVNVGGIAQVRNANATNNTRIADGFCSTVGGIAAGTVGEVQLATGVTSFSGLTPGTRYFLGTVNGLVSAAPATAAGNVEQFIGVAIDSTHLFVNLGSWVQH
jgi:hypothetical protein